MNGLTHYTKRESKSPEHYSVPDFLYLIDYFGLEIRLLDFNSIYVFYIYYLGYSDGSLYFAV